MSRLSKLDIAEEALMSSVLIVMWCSLWWISHYVWCVTGDYIFFLCVTLIGVPSMLLVGMGWIAIILHFKKEDNCGK